MRLGSIFVTAILAVCAVAAPLANDKRNDLAASHETNATLTAVKTPPVPSIAEIKTHMHTPASIAGLSLFYAGPGGYAKLAIARAKTFHPAKKLLKDVWLNSRYPDTWQNDPADSKLFFDRASAAFAQISSGDVFVLLPDDTKGTNFHPGTVWVNEEWPNLESNHNVKRVIRINPKNNDEEVILTH